MFTGINWGEVLSRAIWTAVQAFIGVFAAVQITGIEDAKTAAIAGLSAAGAAVLAFIKNFIQEKLNA